MNKLVKLSIILLSFVILFLFFFQYIVFIGAATIISFIQFNFFRALLGISFFVLLVFAIYILYLYFMKIIEFIKQKKLIKSISMIIITILLLIGLFLIREKMNQNVLMSLLYIVGVIVLPLIILGKVLLSKYEIKKKKIIKIIISVMLLIIIYMFHAAFVLSSAEYVVTYIKNNNIYSLFGIEKKEVNLEYLENYKQKMARIGYLTKYDIKNITDTVNMRSDFIEISYTQTDKIINVNNKQENWKQEIENILEGEYYQFKYTYENEITRIEIKRYESSSDIRVDNEKNSKIFLQDNLKKITVENVRASYENMEAENYTFDNKIDIQEKKQNTELESFKILFSFDSDVKNFIPYVENEEDAKKMKSYKVYSTGITLTLEDNIELTKNYYTIRGNRYDDSLKLKEEKGTFYFYQFEPVVTKLTDWNQNTVLEFKFGNTYLLKNLKNIEILFGYSE